MKKLTYLSLCVLASFMAASPANSDLLVECDFNADGGPGTLHFRIDLESNKAYAAGNNSLEEVSFWKSDFFINFLEQPPAGNLMLTSVHLGTGQGIHSRHVQVKEGIILPSQYVGPCTISED